MVLYERACYGQGNNLTESDEDSELDINKGESDRGEDRNTYGLPGLKELSTNLFRLNLIIFQLECRHSKTILIIICQILLNLNLI